MFTAAGGESAEPDKQQFGHRIIADQSAAAHAHPTPAELGHTANAAGNAGEPHTAEPDAEQLEQPVHAAVEQPVQQPNHGPAALAPARLTTAPVCTYSNPAAPAG